MGTTGKVPESTRTCLMQLKEQGHFVAIATGRLQADALSRAKALGLDCIVADGGNSVTVNGNIIHMESLPVPESIAFIDRLHKQGKPWAVCSENKPERYTPDERFARLINDGFMETIVRPELHYSSLDCLYKVFIPCKAHEEGSIDFGTLPKVRFSPDCMFIEPTDKAKGIKMMMDYLEAPCEDVVVFGDGSNDIRMFIGEWFSVAMGNARSALKERADFITKDCDKDGILYACRHFGWVK